MKAKNGNPNYTVEKLRAMILDCVHNEISSEELGDWAYEAWFYFQEHKENADKDFIDVLMHISSEWGLVSSGIEKEFSKIYLESRLDQINRFMNINEEEEFD